MLCEQCENWNRIRIAGHGEDQHGKFTAYECPVCGQLKFTIYEDQEEQQQEVQLKFTI